MQRLGQCILSYVNFGIVLVPKLVLSTTLHMVFKHQAVGVFYKFFFFLKWKKLVYYLPMWDGSTPWYRMTVNCVLLIIIFRETLWFVPTFDFAPQVVWVIFCVWGFVFGGGSMILHIINIIMLKLKAFASVRTIGPLWINIKKLQSEFKSCLPWAQESVTLISVGGSVYCTCIWCK